MFVYDAQDLLKEMAALRNYNFAAEGVFLRQRMLDLLGLGRAGSAGALKSTNVFAATSLTAAPPAASASTSGATDALRSNLQQQQERSREEQRLEAEARARAADASKVAELMTDADAVWLPMGLACVAQPVDTAQVCCTHFVLIVQHLQ